MVIKNSLHQLVDELPDAELSAALRFLQYLRDTRSDPFVETVMSDLDLGDGELAPELAPEDAEQSVADAWQKYLSGSRPESRF